MIESALRAEPAGFDAIAMINTFDHGYLELPELTRLPVVFITESALHLACQLAPRVGFVTHNRSILSHVGDLARRYGLGERVVRGGHLDLTYDDFPRMYDDPTPCLEAFVAAARPAIGRGAGMLLVAGNPMNMFLLDQGMREVDGVPILDCTVALVKSAELMVDLARMGIRRSASAPGGSVPDGDLARLRDIFE